MISFVSESIFYISSFIIFLNSASSPSQPFSFFVSIDMDAYFALDSTLLISFRETTPPSSRYEFKKLPKLLRASSNNFLVAMFVLRS